MAAGRHGEARNALDRLVKCGALYQQGQFYKTSRAALRRRALAERAAVLWFCCMTSPRRNLLGADDVAALTADTARGARRPVPRSSRLYCDPDGYLGLIRVQPIPEPGRRIRLNKTLARLQSYVNQADFLPWAHLASREKLRLIYLIEPVPHRAELREWLALHPLVSRLRSEAVVVRCDVRLTRYLV